YALGYSSEIQDVKQARLMLAFGCRKNGTEYRDVFINSLGGLTTRWVVDLSLLLVKRCRISPILTTISSPWSLIVNQLPSLVNTSRPSALAPIKSVMRLISSWAPARTASAGNASGFSMGK